MRRTASSLRVARSFMMKRAFDTKKWGPFTFEIDRPKGYKKEWPQDGGSVKKYTYPVDYGYFIGHTGEDEEGLDAFVGDDPEGKIECFLKLKPDEETGDLVPDETKFLVGLTDSQREKVMGLYEPEMIQDLREYDDVYELVDALKEFRDEKTASKVASRFLDATQRGRERNQNGTHVVTRDVGGTPEFLNNTESGGWTKHEYMAVPMPQARAEELARKFHGEAISRPKPIIHNRPVSV